MYLGDATWPEVQRHLEESSLALVPLGSTEQHGPHLPEATDHLIAEALARAAANRGQYLCTPTVTVGVSAHHRQFPGTMWVSPEAFRTYVESLTRNLVYHGIDRVVYVNAHGGNVEPLREVGRRLREADVAYAIEWMWDESIPELVDELFETNGPHAGPKETAMVQYLRGDAVADDRLADARDGGLTDPDEADRLTHGARTTFDSIESSANGAYGDPTDATAEKGEQLFDAATAELLELADWLSARSWEELAPPGPR